ncbi:MAG: DJ-1/PfpI family protein [Bacteroidales bacterium]|nr:DJ-1/PfpI family protein [Bacteroidales bacterium]
MKGIHIFLAEGFEETEAIATYDILCRGGLNVTLVSITDNLTVTGAHGMQVVADTTLAEVLGKQEPICAKDCMVFPGGLPGSSNLAGCEPLIEELNTHYAKGGSAAAICAAPALVLPLLKGSAGSEMTCYDGFESTLAEAGIKYVKADAVRSGRIVTGRGPGHVVPFALQLLALLTDDATAARVSSGFTLK